MELTLTDAALTINGFASTCSCKCKHCLLSSGDRLLPRVPFEQLNRLALRFEGFRDKTGIDVSLCVYHSSDYPQLPQAMETDRRISAYHGYQNLNGTPIRTGKELTEWVAYLKHDCRVEHANLSWFGTREGHDAFVAAPGYFDYLVELSAELTRQEIPVSNSVFILKSNLEQLAELHTVLCLLGGKPHYALLDYRGNAKRIWHEFLDAGAVRRMPSFLFDGGYYNVKRNRMNSEWVDAVMHGDAPTLTKRHMFLVATPDNIERYLAMPLDEIVEEFHALDRRVQSYIPSIAFLAEHYGRVSGEVLLDYRSALWRWMGLFWEDNHLDAALLFSDLHNSVMWR